jgi:hypothetical protein
MHERHLTTDEHTDDCPECSALLDELRSLSKKGARVYSLFAEVRDYRYKLVTTSKDLFLGLGRLSQRARNHLCDRICSALNSQPGPIVYELPSITDEGASRSNRSLLVSLSNRPDDDEAYVLHLSPA